MPTTPDKRPQGSNPISRRDFLKLSGVAAGVAILAACKPVLEPPGELPRTNFNREYVIFDGKTTSIDALDIRTLMHVDVVKSKLDQARSGTLPLIIPEGYKGAALDEGWVLDFDRSVIIVNTTDSGELVSQVVISRKKAEDPAQPDESQGWNDFVNSLAEAFAYNKHSMFVFNESGNPLFIPNVESETSEGKTRISVDGSTGKVTQITTDEPNLIERWFQGQHPTVDLSEIDVLAGESTFEPVMTPFSQGFINVLRTFITRLPDSLTNDQKIDLIRYFFSGSRINQTDIDRLKKFLKIDQNDPTATFLDSVKRFNLDFPYTDEELGFVSAALSYSVKQYLEKGSIIDSFKTIISNIIPPPERQNQETIKKLIELRTKLPMATPELYFVQTKDQKGNLQWFLVGRYPSRENDQTPVWTTQRDAFSIGEYWYTFGEVDQEIVDNKLLRGYEKIIGDFPFLEIAQRDANSNKPLNGSILGGSNECLEVRRVDSEALVYGWDPSENNLNIKIKPGLMIEDNQGKIRFLGVKQDDFWNKNIIDLPLFSNRWLPLIGDSPNIIKDVTDQVVNLIKKGYLSTSLFGLDPMADFSIYGNLDPTNPNSYVNYDFLKNSFPGAFSDIVQPGQFLGGVDNVMLIFSEDEEGGAVKLHIYNKNGQLKEDIYVKHPIIVAPQKIAYYSGKREPYIIIAEDNETHEYIVVDLKNTFLLGARSSEKLAAIATAEIITAAAIIYGGHMIINNPQAAAKFLQKTIEFVAKKLISG